MEKKTKENDGNYFRNHEAFTQASANRTIHSEKSFKHSMILIAEEGQPFLNLEGPLANVVGWRCSSSDGTPDPGSR